MTLDEIIELKNSDQELFERIVGISTDDFDALHAIFEANRLDDATRLYPTEKKVLLILLSKRFELNQCEIRNLFFIRATVTVSKRNFKVINTRFKNALKLLNEKRKKRPLQLSIITRPQYLSQNYQDLSELVNVANLCLSTEGLISGKIRIAQDDERIMQFLQRPLIEKSKRGQDNFLQLVQHLFRDLQEFEISAEDAALYMATVCHFLNHNASHKPFRGAGKAVEREEKVPQEYYRSQSKHQHVVFFKRMVGKKNVQCIMPRNNTLQTVMLEDTNFNSKNSVLMAGLPHYDADGYVMESSDVKHDYFSLGLAHSGLRTNNSAIYYSTLLKSLESLDYNALEKKLIKAELIGYSSKRIPMCAIEELTKRIDYVQQLFRQLPQYYLKSQLLSYKLHQYRHGLIDKIAQECSKLTNIQVKVNLQSICLFINFYPTKITPDNQNYESGITHILIGFLGGLINYYLDIYNIESTTQRRQSFGMYWSSLTDMGKLAARLSVGVECIEYTEAVIAGLKALDPLLNKYDFTNPLCPLVKDGFEVVEKAGGGIRYLKEMRSPIKRVHAIQYAQKHLHSLNGKENHLSLAFKAYIDDVVNGNLSHVPEIPEPILIPFEQTNATQKEPFFCILNNAVALAIYTVIYLEDDIEQQVFRYSYYHLIEKLYGYCTKSLALLHSLDTLTASRAYALGRHLLEHILEYSSPLDCLKRLQVQEGETLNLQIKKLTDKEWRYTKAALKLGQENCYVFYTDCGQSASTAALYMMVLQLYEDDVPNLDKTIYVDPNCYFELSVFLKKDVRLRLCKKPAEAEIVCTDVLSLNSQSKSELYSPNVKMIVLDVTHQPSISEDAVNTFIRHAIEKKKWVVLTSSLLKNEQLGLDKYQCGRITIIAPDGLQLNPSVLEKFKLITADGITPTTASYFRMFNKITREKQCIIKRALLP